MYAMPLIGEKARLYFPNENSEDPIVTGCVRKNGDACEKTSDTSKRYLETEHGSEIAMLPDELSIKGGSKKTLSISFKDKVGVIFTSPKKLTINAGEEIVINTPKNIRITAQSQLLMTKRNEAHGVSIEGEFHIKGNNVIQNEVSEMFSFEDLVSGVEGAISYVGDAVSDAADYVSDEVSEAVDYVSDAVSEAVDYVSDEVSDVVDYVSSEVSEAVDYVSDVADEVSDAVVGATSAIADACEDWASDAEEFFEENYKAVVGAVVTFNGPIDSQAKAEEQKSFWESLWDKIYVDNPIPSNEEARKRYPQLEGYDKMYDKTVYGKTDDSEDDELTEEQKKRFNPMLCRR